MSLTRLPRRVHVGIAVVVALTFFAVMAAGVQSTDAWGQEPAPETDAYDFASLADALFSDHLLAFEVLGILLTAAMIGAMVIARPLVGRPDSEHYATKRHGQDLESIQDVSDVASNLAGRSFAALPDIGGEEE